MQKSLKWITVLVAALAIVLAAVGSLLSGVCNMAGSEALYGEMSRTYAAAYYGQKSEEALTEFIGMTSEEHAAYARKAAQYMSSAAEGEQLNMLVARDGAEQLLLSEKEAQHMQDVRGLVRLADQVSKGCTAIAAALAVVAAWTGLELQRRRRVALIGAVCGIGVVALAAAAVWAAMNAQGFTALFTRLHEWVFTNDLWLMNPETDVLIRMMPETLFVWAAGEAIRKAAGAFAVEAGMLVAVYLVVDGILKRNVQK